MERPTHYTILGVPLDETATAIRAAYRDLAKRLHPDIAGERASPGIREATEAYEVLSYPARREAYNGALDRLAEAQASAPHTFEDRLEPMLHPAASVLGHPESIRPSYAAMHQRFYRNFSGVDVPKAERLEGLNFEVLLTREEALRGCVIPVTLPVFLRCPECDGSGHVWSFPCAICQQQGMLASERTIRLQVPPLFGSGSIYELSLSGLGIHNFYLRVHVFVDA